MKTHRGPELPLQLQGGKIKVEMEMTDAACVPGAAKRKPCFFTPMTTSRSTYIKL